MTPVTFGCSSDLIRRHTGAVPGSDHTVVAVLLAGGGGTRFVTGGQPSERGRTLDAHKLDAGLPATSTERADSVIERALRHAAIAAIGPIVVVTGGWTPRPGSDVVLPGSNIRIIVNDAWQTGQITSVQAGIAAANALGADRVVIGLADQPFVSPDAWRTVAAGPGPICVAVYGGRRGNPVGLDRPVWGLLPTSGDEGARGLMRIRPDLVREVACSGSPADIDTTEDLHRWQNN